MCATRLFSSNTREEEATSRVTARKISDKGVRTSVSFNFRFKYFNKFPNFCIFRPENVRVSQLLNIVKFVGMLKLLNFQRFKHNDFRAVEHSSSFQVVKCWNIEIFEPPNIRINEFPNDPSFEFLLILCF